MSNGQRQQGVLFYCPCTSQLSISRPPSVQPPLSHLRHHPLSNLLFCEECDAIRCDMCVSCEVACYFCPNCLFEVPSASVRGEKNRCARNCFQCPQCSHTLSVVASDPSPNLPLASSAASAGEPPFYLSCSFCQWNSKEIGMTFEKATGLAMQLQKAEDAAPDIAEFDRLRSHFEPYLRRGQSMALASASALASTSSTLLNPAAAAAATSTATAATNLSSSTSLKDARYGALLGLPSRTRQGASSSSSLHAQGGIRDDLEPYTSLYPSRGVSIVTSSQGLKGGTPNFIQQIDRDAESVKRMRGMTDIEEVASIDRRWTVSYQPPLFAEELRPLRTHLQSKLSKRCPVCKHILIKPEQKSTSTRYKIKLVAANYLPGIEIHRRLPAIIGSRLSAIGSTPSASVSRRSGSSRVAGSTSSTSTNSKNERNIEEEPLRPGRTYSYELTFTNPLYEPIQVRLAVARPMGSATSSATSSPALATNSAEFRQSAGGGGVVRDSQMIDEDEAALPPLPPPFAVNLPSPSFSISAFAEEWEYDDEEDVNDMNQEMDSDPLSSSIDPFKRKSAGIVEKKMNRITVLMDVAISRDTIGPLRANMLVTYVYQSDENDVPLPPLTKSPVKGGGGGGLPDSMKKEDAKTFSFWTMVYLGTVTPRANLESSIRRGGGGSGSGTGGLPTSAD